MVHLVHGPFVYVTTFAACVLGSMDRELHVGVRKMSSFVLVFLLKNDAQGVHLRDARIYSCNRGMILKRN